ncbi:MAG: hypothetical protein AVDCRST_MAG93-2048 [uncultured Chloroflexia bacterium]|uniref:Uncharacterized protein n=1 Tax=uncultured Chloroflexia bacterium TaxID=1672391 RepID=A0A6J4IPZ1_9CHLR|nr:MAG: hypothetical protein AVDCRST_MAG93-2048 [uncultured Chloroflexia bacterium]
MRGLVPEEDVLARVPVVAAVVADVEARSLEPVALDARGLEILPKRLDAPVELLDGGRVGGVAPNDAEGEDCQVGISRNRAPAPDGERAPRVRRFCALSHAARSRAVLGAPSPRPGTLPGGSSENGTSGGSHASSANRPGDHSRQHSSS